MIGETTRLGREETAAAAELLRAGGLVSVPTETVYGLAADGLNADAVEGIYEAKGRPETKPLNVLVDGMESETLILRLDQLGFGVSGGSACSSQSLDPSHVLSAMGVQRDAALGALRVSMGRYTTERDVEAFVTAMEQALTWL